MNWSRYRKAKMWVSLLLVVSCSPFILFGAGSGEQERIERLVGLCKLWGTVRYFHPSIDKPADWDEALLKTIPLVNAARDEEAYKNAVESLLSHLGDPSTRAYLMTKEIGPLPTKGIGQQAPEPSQKKQPYLEELQDGIFRVVATDCKQFSSPQAFWGGIFGEAFKQVDSAVAVVLDLRLKCDPNFEGSYLARWALQNSLRTELPLLLAQDVLLPTYWSRIHSGYPTQTGQTSGGYFSGLVIREYPRIQAAGNRQDQTPMVILVNETYESFLELLSGLQRSGVAVVIQDGEDSVTGRSPASTYQMTLPGDLRADIRIAEMVNPDGTVGFQPDFRLPALPVTENDDPASQLAVEVLSGRKERPIQKRGQFLPRAQTFEEQYENEEYPNYELRLLSLFRLWNIIDLFFAYPHLLDRDWEEVLIEAIPRFEAASDELEYALAVAEVVAEMQDTHGSIRSEALDAYFGTHHPPLIVDFVEDQTIVVWLDESLSKENVHVGDVVLSVDGEPLPSRRSRLGRYIAASTPQALNWKLDRIVLLGPERSDAVLEIRGKSGAVTSLKLSRDQRFWHYARQWRNSSDPPYFVVEENVGYADLERLEVGQVAQMFEEFKELPAIIFDIRGYPKGTFPAIGPRLSNERKSAALFHRRFHLSPGGKERVNYSFDQMIEPSSDWKYQGKIVVLINEEAISQSEHTCLWLEQSAQDITFIGSPTNGANGDVTRFPLPGGIWVNFTGHDVRHADGRQLQRIGIQPDILVRPTIHGIRKGIDEVLEEAIRFVRQEISG